MYHVSRPQRLFAHIYSQMSLSHCKETDIIGVTGNSLVNDMLLIAPWVGNNIRREGMMPLAVLYLELVLSRLHLLLQLFEDSAIGRRELELPGKVFWHVWDPRWWFARLARAALLALQHKIGTCLSHCYASIGYL